MGLFVMAKKLKPTEKFGEQIPFCEPYWYQGYHSPHFHDGHRAFRNKVREFVEKELIPYRDEWIKTGYPVSLHEKIYQAGISGIIYPREYGGTKPDDFDSFYEMVLIDEISRVGGGVLGQLGINSMALPPIIQFGSDYLKDLVLRDVITGKKSCCLAISEPYAGSDVANLQTSAVPDGDFYVVNGQKKWITGGMMGDFFTTAVRTGDDGMGGLSLLLIERNTPGVSIRKMETQFDNSHSTTFIILDDVRVPKRNLIGEEGMGFLYIVRNFNHERFVISAGTCREARTCYSEAFKYAMERKTFGKSLISHQIIRFKLAEMARQIESLYDSVERIGYQFQCGVPDQHMGPQCALLKVNASKTFEFCAREASQIFGGSSIVKEGKGKVVERLYRNVRAAAIPGGSEEILLDFTIRQAAAKAKRLQSNL